MMQSSYNLWLVALSLAVAMLASYTALDLAGRITIAPKNRRIAWLTGGAIAMGVGIWSMHFIGMLAFSLPIALGYDIGITALSLGIAIGVSFFALSIVTRGHFSLARLVLGGILMGIGIAGMHYTGMAAMRMQPSIVYEPMLFALSVLIAMVASMAALGIAYTLSDESQAFVVAKRIAAAAVMGIAITGMHYTGMAAAQFHLGDICLAADGVDSRWLAATITVFTLAMLALALLLSRFEATKTVLVRTVSHLDGQLLRLAALDPLTDLPNRKTLSEVMERAIVNAQRSRTMFAVIFMDIDGFKNINDSMGHSAGDAVLKSFAHRLQDCVRNSDTVARLGGDEFVVLVENLVAVAGAEDVAKKILERMQDNLVSEGVPLQVTPSMGIALFPQDGDTVEALLRNSDAAMYSAKSAGRNTYRLFEREMNVAAARAILIQRALHDAIAEQLFTVEFQPKFDAEAGGLVGAEALIRLHHSEAGTIPPLDFIQVAERSGQIVSIGYWVVEEVCRQMQAWVREGLPDVTIAINLSPRQFVESDLAEKMHAIVSAAGIDPRRILFEITESAAMGEAERTAHMFEQFQRVGFEIAIDDFGTGYSSLAYLQRFRVKQLKIDRFFVSGLDSSREGGHAIVTAIIALARALQMEVVAEGVETHAQLEALRTMQCDHIQGFLLGRPMTAVQFAGVLDDHAQTPPA